LAPGGILPRQQSCVGRSRTECIAHGAHRKSRSVQKRGAGILHEVPAISDLSGIAQRPSNSLAIAATQITREDANAGMAARQRSLSPSLPIAPPTVHTAIALADA